MTRRRFTGKAAEHMAGRLAWFDGRCSRCDGPILVRQSQVVMRRGRWIHTACAPGGDE